MAKCDRQSINNRFRVKTQLTKIILLMIFYKINVFTKLIAERCIDREKKI